MVETESSGRQRAHRGVSLQMACTCEDRFGSKCEELKTSIKSPLLPSKRTLERTSQLVVRATRQHRRRSKQLGWNAPVPRSKSSSVHTVWQQIRVQRATNGCGIWL